MNSINLIITLFVVSFVDSIKRDKIIACVYNVDKGPPSVIDANLCTHVLVQGIFTMGSAPHHLVFQNYERNKKILDRLKGLKSQNPDLKIVASLECYKHECYFNRVITPEKRTDFVNSAIKVIREHKFIGLDLGWRYPESNEKEGYSDLLKQLKSGLSDKETLSAVVYPFSSENYDMTTMNSLDFLSLWSFDVYGPWYHETEHHAPDGKIKEWIEHWTGKMENDNKILLGIGFFGVESELIDKNNNGYYQSIVQRTDIHNRSQYSMPYNQICQHIKKGEWNVGQGEYLFREPYAYKEKRWISFENPDSVERKAEWIRSKNKYGQLGGVFVWEITDDDIDGKCPFGDRPLLRKVAKGIFN